MFTSEMKIVTEDTFRAYFRLQECEGQDAGLTKKAQIGHQRTSAIALESPAMAKRRFICLFSSRILSNSPSKPGHGADDAVADQCNKYCIKGLLKSSKAYLNAAWTDQCEDMQLCVFSLVCIPCDASTH